MLDSAKTKNVIEATNKPHLFEKLEDLQKRFFIFIFFQISLHFNYAVNSLMSCPLYSHTFKRLALCEKALAEYLETKRLEFPRFYFISSADLLDILSKGSRPREVHLFRISLLIFIQCYNYTTVSRVKK